MSTLNRDALHLLLTGNQIAARMPTKSEDLLGWIAVINLDEPCSIYLNKLLKAKLGKLRIIVFEVPREVYSNNYDITYDECTRWEDYHVHGIEELTNKIVELGVSPSELVESRKVGCPW